MKIKAVSIATAVRTFTLPKGAILSDLLRKWRYPRKYESIFINKQMISNFNTRLKNNDIVIIVAPVIGAAPPLQMRKFKKYLMEIGFNFHEQGKGDHEIWIDSRGIKLTVNPNKLDKRCVDWASVSALKRISNCSEGDLIKRINSL